MSNNAAATRGLSAEKQGETPGKTPVDETRRLLPFTVLSGFLGADPSRACVHS